MIGRIIQYSVIKRLLLGACNAELLPVKRTVKQNKIVEQSVSYGTDCFYVSSDFVATTPTSRMNVAAKRSICRIHTSPSVSAHQDFSVIS